MTLAIAKGVVMRNTLVDADSSRCLFVSLWMTSPEQQRNYHKFEFVEAAPLMVPTLSRHVPVRTDPATSRYLTSRRVTYQCEEYVHSETSTIRARITALRIEEIDPQQWTDDAPITDLSFDDFLARFLEAYGRGGVAPADDDDENEEELPRKHDMVD